MSMTALLITAPLVVLAVCTMCSRAMSDDGFGVVTESDGDGSGGDGGD